MITSSVRSLVQSLVTSLVGRSDYTPEERIVNGGFDSGDNWTIVGAKWVIAGGVATENGTGNGLNQDLGQTFPAGTSVAYSFLFGGASLGVDVYLTASGTPTDTLFSGTPLGGVTSGTLVANFDFDGIRFVAGGGSTTVDDVSLIC